ncbi:MAG: STAS domain-containing protein [Gammaproteobacteria bacterium]|nr:STAS domain-containing protein [Gammaproteobacteria bacterium]MBT4494273.1 STAS domain-containing protein [Gammaproteobacteria bacterium]MBT7371179.1 STAS domain-containing protein [Gammaproteobacteria bacterium]
MKVELVGNDCWKVAGHLNLGNLMSWRASLEQQLSLDTAITIDLSELDFEGSEALALLVFLTRSARAAGGGVRFTAVSDRLSQMAEMAELSMLEFN